MAKKIGPLDPSGNLDPDIQTLPDGVILQSHGQVAGETIAQWSQDWWTWALQTPFATSPMLDTTGANASVGNTGAMFFIAGSFGGDVTREFEVPADKPLLVPVLNALALQYTGRGPDPSTGGQGAANQYQVGWRESVTDIFLKIDGQSIGKLQTDFVKTDWFSSGTVQPGSVAEAFGLTGDLGLEKSSGYWAVLKGFAPGSTHTLEFGGSWDNGTSSVHITDTIHVV